MRPRLSVNPIGTLRRQLRHRRRRRARRVLRAGRGPRLRSAVNPAAHGEGLDFRFYAVLGTWMEEDIVEATVRNALSQGVERVFLVDNASTDATVERAVAAGAELAETFETEAYEERVRILLMNALVARVSLAEKVPHIWWLWLDADEFPEGPDGMSIAEYLRRLDGRFRVVGSTYYNHLPTTKPEYIPGFHPIDFQPMCERFSSAFVPRCAQHHWKHPLQRFDRVGPFLTAGAGFHSVVLRGRQPLYEPEGGIVTHHITYREEAATRARMELLCGGPGRNGFNDAVGNRTIQRRFDSLDAVYAQDWARVNNLRGEDTSLGVTPTPWPDTGRTRRWYDRHEVDAAKERWRAAYPLSSSR